MAKKKTNARYTKVNPLEFRDRLEVLYMAVTGSKSPLGSQLWFSQAVRVDRRTVGRWCDGTNPPPHMVLVLLRYMEDLDAGEEFLERAQARRTEYYEKRGDG